MDIAENSVTDAFAGGGGLSLGIHQGGGDVLCAINHDPLAIQTHSANFPNTLHLCKSIDRVNPADCPRTRILAAAPECTNFSYGKGDAPRVETSRWLAWALLPFIEYHRYEWLVIENVPAFKRWGRWTPLGTRSRNVAGKYSKPTVLRCGLMGTRCDTAY